MLAPLKPLSFVNPSLSGYINSTIPIHAAILTAIDNQDLVDPNTDLLSAVKDESFGESVSRMFWRITNSLLIQRRFSEGDQDFEQFGLTADLHPQFNIQYVGRLDIVDPSEYDRSRYQGPSIDSPSLELHKFNYQFFLLDKEVESQILLEIKEISYFKHGNLDSPSILETIKRYVNYINKTNNLIPKQITIKDFIDWFGEGDFDLFIDKVQNAERNDFENLFNFQDFHEALKFDLNCKFVYRRSGA